MVDEIKTEIPVVEVPKRSGWFSFKGFSFKTLISKNAAKTDTYVKIILSAVVVFYAPQMLADPNYQMLLNGATFVVSKLVLDVIQFFITPVDL